MDGIEFTMNLFEKYGPIVKFDGIFGQPAMILLSDPESSAYVRRFSQYLCEFKWTEMILTYNKIVTGLYIK